MVRTAKCPERVQPLSFHRDFDLRQSIPLPQASFSLYVNHDLVYWKVAKHLAATMLSTTKESGHSSRNLDTAQSREDQQCLPACSSLVLSS